MKIISRILILAMFHLCWLTSYGWAEMVSTESATEQPSTSNTDRQRLLDLLNRGEVVGELEKYGISKVEAVARINSLTDEEVTEIAGKLDELPPGGFANALAAAALLALFLALYIPGLLIKTIECIFSDCEAKGGASYIFTPFWKDERITISPQVKAGFCFDNCNSDYNGCINTDNGENIQKSQCEIEYQMCDKQCVVAFDNDLREDTTEEECDPGMESCV